MFMHILPEPARWQVLAVPQECSSASTTYPRDASSAQNRLYVLRVPARPREKRTTGNGRPVVARAAPCTSSGPKDCPAVPCGRAFSGCKQ